MQPLSRNRLRNSHRSRSPRSAWKDQLATQVRYTCARKRIAFVTNVEWKTQFSCRIGCRANPGKLANRTSMLIDREQPVAPRKISVGQPTQEAIGSDRG
jgi:hypothetical protein